MSTILHFSLLVALGAGLSGCFASHGLGEGTDGGAPPTSDGSTRPPTVRDAGRPIPPPPMRRDAGPTPPPPAELTEACSRVCDHLLMCAATDPDCIGGCVDAGTALSDVPECGALFGDLLGCLEGATCDELLGEEPPAGCTMVLIALEDLGCTMGAMMGGGGMSGGDG